MDKKLEEEKKKQLEEEMNRLDQKKQMELVRI